MSQRRCFLCGGKMALRYHHRDSYQQRLGREVLITDSDGRVVDGKIVEKHLFCCTSCANWWLICRGMTSRWNGIWTSSTRHPPKGNADPKKFEHRYPYAMDDEEYKRVELQYWRLID